MIVKRAGMEETAAVMEIIRLCVGQMRESGSDQWDEVYPNEAVIRSDAENGALFVLRDGKAIAGAIVLNETQSPEYLTADWSISDPRPLVIHRLCVHPNQQGKGAARLLMDFAEEFAAANGYHSIRLDTYTGNPKAVGIYQRRGYRITGTIQFPRRRLPFICLERATGID